MSSDIWQIVDFFQEVITLDNVGIKGDRESVEKAYKLIKKIRLQVRDNALVDAS